MNYYSTYRLKWLLYLPLSLLVTPWAGRDIKNAVFKAVVAAAREDKPKGQKCVTQSHFAQSITEIIEANKVASKQEVKLTPVDDTVELPPQANAENDS